MRISSLNKEKTDSEISFLAILETIFASFIAVYLSIKYQTIAHLALVSCIVPIFLMRTEFSTNILFKLSSFALQKKFPDYNEVPSFKLPEGLITFPIENSGIKVHALEKALFPIGVSIAIVGFLGAVSLSFIGLSWLYVFGFILLAVFFSLVKFAASSCGMFLRFQETIQSIPKNWVHLCFCNDIFSAPEVLPGINQAQPKSIFTFETTKNVLGVLFKRRGYLSYTYVTIGIPLLISQILLIVIAFLYRMFIKSSALVWLPIIWVVGSSYSKESDLSSRIEDNIQSPTEQLIRVISLFMFVCFYALPFVFTYFWNTNVIPNVNLLNPYIAKIWIITPQIESWHISRLLTYLLTFGLYWWSLTLLKEIKKNKVKVINKKKYYKIFNALLLSRGILSLYTILCAVYLMTYSIRLEDVLNILPSRLFPWQ